MINHRNTLSLSDETIMGTTDSFSAIMEKLEELANERKKIINALDVEKDMSVQNHSWIHISTDHAEKTVNQISEFQCCQEFQNLLEKCEETLSKLAFNVQRRNIDLLSLQKINFSLDLKANLVSRSLSSELVESFESEKNKIGHLLANISEYDEGARLISEIIDVYFHKSLDYYLAKNLLSKTKCKTKKIYLASFNPEIYEWLEIFYICSDKRELLDSIVKTQEGVKWLKKEIDTKEDLNAFIQLADIAAGENDVEVDRIQALTLVGNMLWPFLLFAREGEKPSTLEHLHNFRTMLTGIFKVYKKHETSLTSKILDLLSGDFGWLKSVKASHGSVGKWTM